MFAKLTNRDHTKPCKIFGSFSFQDLAHRLERDNQNDDDDDAGNGGPTVYDHL